MTIREYIQNTINSIPESLIFYVVAGMCILEPVSSPVVIFTGLLLYYLKKPNFLDSNEIYVTQRTEMLKSIEEELEEETNSNDEIIYNDIVEPDIDNATTSDTSNNTTYNIIDNEPVIMVSNDSITDNINGSITNEDKSDNEKKTD